MILHFLPNSRQDLAARSVVSAFKDCSFSNLFRSALHASTPITLSAFLYNNDALLQRVV